MSQDKITENLIANLTVATEEKGMSVTVQKEIVHQRIKAIEVKAKEAATEVMVEAKVAEVMAVAEVAEDNNS